MLQWIAAECAPEIVLRVTAAAGGLRSIDFDLSRAPLGDYCPENPVLAEAARQLRAYFAGDLRQFSLPLDPEGTAFQKRVWRELEAIPFGAVRSYAQIARAIGAPKACRAVGAANGANPLPIVVPCHRVIGSSGKLVGYGGGLALKKRLLAIEGCTIVLFID